MPMRLAPAVQMSGSAGLAGLTVVELKARLKKAGLPVSGNKAELIDRIGAGPLAAPPPAQSDAAVAIEFCRS